MKQLTVQEGQTLINIAVQELGDADGLATICILNDLEFDADLPAGMVLQIPEVIGNDVVDYFSDQRIEVNSHLTAEELNLLSTNDDEPLDIVI